MKLDGKFHTLNVNLKNHSGLELQVRKGYYAPNTSTDPADQAKQEVEEAFFSHDEVHDLAAVLGRPSTSSSITAMSRSRPSPKST